MFNAAAPNPAIRPAAKKSAKPSTHPKFTEMIIASNTKEDLFEAIKQSFNWL